MMTIGSAGVVIPLGGVYRGPGGPDPSKTREQREDELLRMIPTEPGRAVIGFLYHEAANIPHGRQLPIGMLYSRMVETVLQHEYPDA